ncbi:MAG: hypothetical protein U0074_00980 [Kouleothrix sp.]
MRCRIANRPGMFGRLTTAIGENGGDIGAIDIVRAERDVMICDISRCGCKTTGMAIGWMSAINMLPGVEVLQSSDHVFLAHLASLASTAACRSKRATIFRQCGCPAWRACASALPPNLNPPIR